MSMAMFVDGASFLSPLPKRSRSVFTLLRPLNVEVWLFLCFTFLLVVPSMKYVSCPEEVLVERALSQWTS